MFVVLVAAWPRIVEPTTELALLPSHQSQVVCSVPMSVALWTPAMPPPFWTYLMIDVFSASRHNGPGGPAEEFSRTIASYFAALSQLLAAPPLPVQSSQSTVNPASCSLACTTGRPPLMPSV